VASHLNRPLGLPVAGQRADSEPSIQPDPRQLLDAVDVDQMIDPGQPQGEEQHQALACGQDLGVSFVLGEQIDGLVGVPGQVVIESGQLHFFPRYLLRGRDRTADHIYRGYRTESSSKTAGRGSAAAFSSLASVVASANPG
jgi:hypothetical protein